SPALSTERTRPILPAPAMVNVFQPSAVRKAASPISETAWPLKSSRKSRCRSAWKARARSAVGENPSIRANLAGCYKQADMALRAVLFDVDFTIAKPGPDLGPEGYRRLGERFGLSLDPERYGEARAQAVGTLERTE